MSSSDGARGILGKSTLTPACYPAAISALMTLGSKSLHMSLMPLHNPFAGSRLLKRIIGHPIFKRNEQDEEKLDIQHSQSVSDEDMDDEDDLDDFIEDANVDDEDTDDDF
nr:hypothetical protein [Tanacetum cinerariifolium]